jgi:hypothetical protein
MKICQQIAAAIKPRIAGKILVEENEKMPPAQVEKHSRD